MAEGEYGRLIGFDHKINTLGTQESQVRITRHVRNYGAAYVHILTRDKDR